jgi:hypothetical protein
LRLRKGGDLRLVPACSGAFEPFSVDHGSEQAAVGGDPGAVEFQLDPAVEIDPQRLRCRFAIE